MYRNKASLPPGYIYKAFPLSGILICPCQSPPYCRQVAFRHLGTQAAKPLHSVISRPTPSSVRILAFNRPRDRPPLTHHLVSTSPPPRVVLDSTVRPYRQRDIRDPLQCFPQTGVTSVSEAYPSGSRGKDKYGCSVPWRGSTNAATKSRATQNGPKVAKQAYVSYSLRAPKPT